MTSDAAPAEGAVVVGIPVHDQGRVDDLVARVQASLGARHEPSSWRIVVARTASAGGAAETMTSGEAGVVTDVTYARHPSDSLQVPYHGLPGRARAIHALFQNAHDAQASGCIVVDPQSGGDVEWLDGFVEALVPGGVDFVGPVYGRHPFSGALVHGVVAPVFRGLYGVRLRYPIGAHFACSARLIDAVVADSIWESDAGQFGIDLWLASSAVTGGLRLGQATVPARPAEDRPDLDLSTTVAQVVGIVFGDLERRARLWQRGRSGQDAALFGRPLPEPDAPPVDAAALAESFRHAYRELEEVWAEVLPPLSILQWRRLATAPLETFRVADALWARTLYDFAMGYRLRVITRDHLLRSMTPMYLAWLASFVLETRALPFEEAEARLDRLGRTFEAEKPYLVSQWRWPERFKPVKLRR